MAAMGCVILLSLAMAGCSDLRSSMPTSPTGTDARRVIRAEHWTLTLTVREVYGAGECDAGIGSTRQVPLLVEFSDDGAVTMRFESDAAGAGRDAEWMGWLHGRGVEASGVAFEPLPCGDERAATTGTPTLLTGYFSGDGQSFTGTEMRRNMSAATGELVYYFDWRAQR